MDSQVALITGGGSGIGQATCLAFARAGAKVVVADVSPEGGEATAHAIQKDGGDAIFIRADVCRSEDVERMVKTAAQHYGRIDCAHNNAGINGDFVSVVDCSEENWDRLMTVNLRSVWLGMKYEIPQMLKLGRGAIVNTGSVAALAGYRTMGAYCASKAGILGLTKVAALEYATKGIRVNAICPSTTRTALIAAFVGNNPELERAMDGVQPMQRMATPEEVANTVVWLCSKQASFVTGAIVPVDGGTVAEGNAFPPMPE